MTHLRTVVSTGTIIERVGSIERIRRRGERDAESVMITSEIKRVTRSTTGGVDQDLGPSHHLTEVTKSIGQETMNVAGGSMTSTKAKRTMTMK